MFEFDIGGEGAVVVADGEDQVLRFGQREHLVGFGDAVGDGFFDERVDSGGERVEGHGGVEVVGGGEDDGVEGLFGEEVAIVGVGFGGVGLGGGVGTVGVEVADGGELGAGVGGEVFEVAAAHAF